MVTRQACTCHPGEAPIPCAERYAYSECIAADKARRSNVAWANRARADGVRDWQEAYRQDCLGLPPGGGGGKPPDRDAPTYGELVNRAGAGRQAETEHPLTLLFGWSRPSHWLWRRSRRAYVFAMACKDIWLIARGRVTLHRAYQVGYDKHIIDESARRARGGR